MLYQSTLDTLQDPGQGCLDGLDAASTGELTCAVKTFSWAFQRRPFVRMACTYVGEECELTPPSPHPPTKRPPAYNDRKINSENFRISRCN